MMIFLPNQSIFWLISMTIATVVPGTPSPSAKKPDPSRSSILSPIKEMGTSHPTSAVAFPPKRIVTLRGRSAKCFDFEYPEGGWKELPNLSAWRDIPSAIAADGKIYVAGFPRIFSGTKTFVDVYDPIWNERSWYKIENVELPDLDSPIPGGTFISDATRGRHILFHGPAFGNAAAASVLYTFHLDTAEINYAECPFPRLVEGAAVVVDGYICAFVRTNADMRAYDLTTKKWIPNPVSGLDDIDWNCANLRLLPIGRKKMCIISDDSIIRDGQEADKGYLNEGQMSVRCRLTIFDVEKKDDDHGLKANIISSTIFIVPGGSIIHGCIVI